MNREPIQRFFSILLLGTLAFSVLSCRQNAGQNATGTEESDVTQATLETDDPGIGTPLEITADFTVFCAEPNYTPAFSSLLNRMKAVTGKTPKIITNVARMTEKKIVVGTCTDERYRDAFRGLHAGDYFVEIVDRNTVLIGGGSQESLEKALKLFLTNCLLTETPTLKIGDKIEQRGAPAAIDHFLLNGHDFGSYIICTTSIALKPLAEHLREEVVSRTNEISPVIRVDTRIPKEPCIVIRQYPADCNEFSYRIYAKNNQIILEGAQLRGVTLAVETFLRESFEEGQSGTVNRTVSTDDGFLEFCVGDQVVYADGNRIGKSACTDSGLQLQTTASEALFPGIGLSTRNYTNRNGKNVTVHALVCEPETVQPVCLMPNADYTPKTDKGSVATVPKMIEAATAGGMNLCAAINGDFFYMGGSNLPTGYCYHNGVKIYETSDTSPVYSVFATLRDGSFYCGSWARLCAMGKQNDVVEVVGGRNQLLANGHFTDLGYLSESSVTEFSLTCFTRSAIGFDKQGRIYLVTVDKPGDNTSAGATLTDLAEILLDLGATDAINLDGGGSSTLVVRSQTENQFHIANVLCVSTARKVANGIGLILTGKPE